MTAFIVALEARLQQAGLDLLHPFVLDETLDALFPFPRFGQHQRLGLIVGNTRALWPPFTRWVKERPGLPHPVQTYVETALERALDETCPTRARATFHAHRLDYPLGDRNGPVPMQRLGQAVGMAALGPGHLSAHPTFGPWFAYRAVVAVNLPPLTAANAPRELPCATCHAPCKSALDVVLALPEPTWRDWIPLRDACPEHPEARYGEHQLAYHYSKDPTHLLP